MATYALTYATRAAFDTALASGDIYTLMQGVTSSQPSVAIAAHITESGETFSCGTNVMIDIKSVGPGDYVLYDTTNKKFFGIASKWIDNNYPSQPTQHILIFKAGVLPARFVVCGTVIKRFGNRIRLAGVQDSLPWSTSNTSGYEWVVAALTAYNYIIKKNGSTTNSFLDTVWASFASLRYLEAYYPNGNEGYLPITRVNWEAAVAAGNTTVTQNGKTATLADYDNSYDKWFAENFSPKFPAANGGYIDQDGVFNTIRIVAEFVSNHGKTAASEDYAAGYCYNYTPNNSCPGLERHKWFLGTVKDVCELRALTHTLQIAIAWGGLILWSSSQAGDAFAWNVYGFGTSSRDRKYYVFACIPLADLILNT